MSKMDDMRAMREARFGGTAPRPATAAASASGPPPTKVARPAARPAKAERPASPASDAPGRPCGHRAISGRTCTREHGHDEKSHRYS